MISERLLVFVSSTITECAAERRLARNAITSLNHEPVLFEDIGARPHPPREVYLARINESHVFVGIYRESYGWVAPEMTVSGIEDEFNIATARGMDRLVYVREKGTRDESMSVFLERVKHSGITIAWYADESELVQRLRDDITAVVSSRFVLPDIAEPRTSPADVLAAVVPDAAHRLTRGAASRELLGALAASNCLYVIGELGVGKTVLLAQLALAHGWLYVDARGLSKLGLTKQLLRAVGGEPMSSTAIRDETVAEAKLRTAWAGKSEVTLIVDGVAEAQWLGDLLAPGVTSLKRLIISPRDGIPPDSRLAFVVPPMSLEEIASYVAIVRGTTPSSVELEQLATSSRGNPLYLRFFAFGQSRHAEASLRQQELSEWAILGAQSKEFVAYLAIAGRPLSLVGLQALLGYAAGSVAEAAEQLAICAFLTRQSSKSVELIHDHLRGTLLEEIRRGSASFAFYSRRIAAYLVEQGDVTRAYIVLDDAGEQNGADKLLDRAAFDSITRGYVAASVRILQRKVAVEIQKGASEDGVRALLSLAIEAHQAGEMHISEDAVTRAQNLATELKSSNLSLMVRETALQLTLSKTADESLLDRLQKLRGEYEANNDSFGAGRIALHLSTEFVANDDAVAAAREASDALAKFVEVGDAYGARLARFNLASALSAIPERRLEGYAMAAVFADEIDADSQPRERAIICNILSRRARQRDEPKEAALLAAEAVEIGELLGDKRLAALNRINLGNAFRDQNLIQEAMAQYQLADRAANSISDVRLEVAANELIASVHNQLGKPDLALHHATHAAGLARGTTYKIGVARALEEKAEALESQREYRQAIASYVEAAQAIATGGLERGLFRSLVTNALVLCAEHELHQEMLDAVIGVFGAQRNERQGMVGDLCTAIPRMLSRLPADRVVAVTALVASSILDSVPKPIERALVRRIGQLVVAERSAEVEPKLAALAGLLLASSWEHLHTSDVVALAEQVCAVTPSIYYKPQGDGAPHWTVGLPLGRRIVCTIAEIDDVHELGIAAMVLALLLKASTSNVATLLGSEHTPRTEFQVQLISEKTFVQNVDKGRDFLGKEIAGPFVVSQSTDLTTDDQPPIVVICKADFAERWHPHKELSSKMHLMLGSVLSRAVTHLLAKEVAEEIVRPKLVSLVRRFTLNPT